MPNIFKQFLGSVRSYDFPQADELTVDDLEPTGPPEPEQPEAPPPEQTSENEESKSANDDAAALFSYARIQAEEIMAQARRDGEALLERSRQQAEPGGG